MITEFLRQGNLSSAFCFIKMNIKNLTLSELEEFLKRNDIPAFHSRQIFSWIYKKRVNDFQLMSDLSKELRDFLLKNFDFGLTKIITIEKSKDGTKKYAFQLKDKNTIESVLIPAKSRLTICLSTQVGCKFNCSFCLSASVGFVRNLETAEIIDQFILAEKNVDRPITHIVFMGIGEPLDNYGNVLKAIRIFNSKFGPEIGARRITISTSGVIPSIKKLSGEKLQFELSVSLHSAIDSVRAKLMPINKKYPLDKLMPTLKEYIEKTNRQITFEYVLLKGINADKINAEALIKLLKGLNCKINIIVYNISSLSKFSPPDLEQVNRFQSILEKGGINVILRQPRGQDINAACGQLRANYLNNA